MRWTWQYHRAFWNDLEGDPAFSEATGVLLACVEHCAEHGRPKHKPLTRPDVYGVPLIEVAAYSVFFFYADLGGASLVGLLVGRDDYSQHVKREPRNPRREPSTTLWDEALRRLNEIAATE